MKPVLIFVLLLGGCAATPPDKDIILSDKIEAACKAEGGCMLHTVRALRQLIEEAFDAGTKAARGMGGTL